MFLAVVALVLILLSTLMIWTNIEQRSLFGLYMIQVRFRINTAWFQMREWKFLLLSELVIQLLLFISGCQCVTARLPEQYGLRLETAQLHGGRSWGEYTLGGTRPPGLLWWITEDPVLIVASKRIERHCCAAAQHAGLRKTDCMPAHFMTLWQLRLKHKMFLSMDWRWNEIEQKDEEKTKTL